MGIPPVGISALSGLRDAEARLDRAATETAAAVASVPEDRVSLGGGGPDLIHATTERITGEAAFRANLKTLQSAQEMNDTLLSLFAR